MSGFHAVKTTWNSNQLPKCWVTNVNCSLLPTQGLLDVLQLISYKRKHGTQVGWSHEPATQVSPLPPRLTPKVFCDLQRGDGGSSSICFPHPTACLLVKMATQPHDSVYKLWHRTNPMESLSFYIPALWLPAISVTSLDLSFLMCKKGMKVPAPLGPFEDEMK